MTIKKESILADGFPVTIVSDLDLSCIEINGVLITAKDLRHLADEIDRLEYATKTFYNVNDYEFIFNLNGEVNTQVIKNAQSLESAKESFIKLYKCDELLEIINVQTGQSVE